MIYECIADKRKYMGNDAVILVFLPTLTIKSVPLVSGKSIKAPDSGRLDYSYEPSFNRHAFHSILLAVFPIYTGWPSHRHMGCARHSCSRNDRLPQANRRLHRL